MVDTNEKHPHDGYAYAGCKGSYCAQIRNRDAAFVHGLNKGKAECDKAKVDLQKILDAAWLFLNHIKECLFVPAVKLHFDIEG